MIPLKEVAVLDKNADFFGTSTGQLMENAGKTAADVIHSLFLRRDGKTVPSRIVLCCGTGNNGGDGFVIARYLSRYCPSCPIDVVLLGQPSDIRGTDAQQNFIHIRNIGQINITEWHEKNIQTIYRVIDTADIIVDAMLGAGFTGALREPFAQCAGRINASRSAGTKRQSVIAIDIPTGLGMQGAIKPDMTLTFHDSKEGMDAVNSGTIKILPIGIPSDALTYVGPGEIIAYYPVPKEHARKGDNGRLLVIGGGEYTGAPALVALAAYRTGVDLVSIAAPAAIAPIIAGYSPNLIVRSIKGTTLSNTNLNDVLALAQRADAIVLGPGIGSSMRTDGASFVESLIAGVAVPLVIDADAIGAVGTLLAEKPDVLKNHKGVITPHPGEFRKLTNAEVPQDLESRKAAVVDWAQKTGFTIVLKGLPDIISDGTTVKLNDIHNVSMTVGGTGDVLAGIVGGLLAKGASPFNAARIGTFINGYAGNLAQSKMSYGTLATDIIERIPEALSSFLR